MLSRIPYRRLSAFYFCYFAVLGALVPYWPIYLKDQGFNPQSIGILSAIIMATKIVAPNIWGWLADHTGKRMSIIRFGSFMAFLTFFGLYFDNTFTWIAIVVLIYSFFWNAVLAQFEVVTLDYLHESPEAYSRVRLWGSVGFIVAVAGLGFAFDYIAVHYLLLFIAVGLGLTWLSSLFIKAAPRHYADDDNNSSIFSVLKKPEVICFFVVCFLMQISHGPYYTFFSLYLESYGYSKTSIGELWALGVVAEVILFWYMHRLIPRWGVRFCLLLSLWITAFRWVLLAYFPDNLAVMLFSQCLHAFSFGSFHAAAIELVRRFFSSRHAGRGQALYSSLSYGAGSALGALLSGYLWVWNQQYTFLLAALMSALAALIAWKGLHVNDYK